MDEVVGVNSMSTRRWRYDAGYLTSAVLLAALAMAAVTGVVADVWDLNQFVYHTYAGYAVMLLATVHVYLHFGRLVGYWRWRTGRAVAAGGRQRGPSVSGQGPQGVPGRQAGVSRRALVGLLLGAAGGFFVGRGSSEPGLGRFGGDLGVLYHAWSKPNLLGLLATATGWGDRPEAYKHYPQAKRIGLPPPEGRRGLYTEEAIQRRRSVRHYSREPLTLSELSQLLYYTDGINAQRRGHQLRAAPSAGALYPIEIYPVVHRVQELEAGLYHYAVYDHRLELLRAGDLQGRIVRAGLMQDFLGEANLVLVLTAVFQRLRWKYRERSYRYALLEAGHVGQNVYLAATSMGLGACAVGAFQDDELNELLGVDGQEEAALYMLAVGRV